MKLTGRVLTSNERQAIGMPTGVFLVDEGDRQTLAIGRKQGEQIIGTIIGITNAQRQRLEQVSEKVRSDRKADSKGKQKAHKKAKR